MRLVDILISLLEAHAQTLQSLATLVGEERLLRLLEEAGELDQDYLTSPLPKPEWFDPPMSSSDAGSYTELEGAVREFGLPEVLEFNLWAYPPYRSFVESDFPLESRVRMNSNKGEKREIEWIEEIVNSAQTWIRRLPLPSEISTQAERAAEIPWLRFRATVLKRIGKRPLRVV